MAKTPKKPEEIFSEITKDFKETFGNDLLSIILYGSGADGSYQPGKSDLNFLIILSETGINHLEKAIKTVRYWKKRKVATPFFMTESYIMSSLDSYPIEFLDMKKNHVLIFGEDILNRLSFNPHYIRLQCERELKGKILHLREGFIETQGQEKQLRNLIKISLKAFIAIFRALLSLKDKDIPRERRKIIISTAKEFSINPDIFLKCLDIREEIDNFSSSDVQTIFKAYLNEVVKLSELIDKFEI
ncbi:MAG: hypothetical protein JW786_04720 [Desulfobacterales bacterium]|nr:hypothetical protein [Desulfobacterales bacterium]